MILLLIQWLHCARLFEPKSRTFGGIELDSGVKAEGNPLADNPRFTKTNPVIDPSNLGASQAEAAYVARASAKGNPLAGNPEYTETNPNIDPNAPGYGGQGPEARAAPILVAAPAPTSAPPSANGNPLAGNPGYTQTNPSTDPSQIGNGNQPAMAAMAMSNIARTSTSSAKSPSAKGNPLAGNPGYTQTNPSIDQTGYGGIFAASRPKARGNPVESATQSTQTSGLPSDPMPMFESNGVDALPHQPRGNTTAQASSSPSEGSRLTSDGLKPLAKGCGGFSSFDQRDSASNNGNTHDASLPMFAGGLNDIPKSARRCPPCSSALKRKGKSCSCRRKRCSN